MSENLGFPTEIILLIFTKFSTFLFATGKI